jgi:transcriptional regulator with XRE-family HTH domain
MIDGSALQTPISKEELWDDYYANLHAAYNSLHETFAQSGMTQDDLAEKIGCSKSLISKRLNGYENLTLKTLSFMGTGMGHRLEMKYVPYDQMGMSNQFASTPLHVQTNSATGISSYVITGTERVDSQKTGSETKLLELA